MKRAKTKSEAIFEEFLRIHNLLFEPIVVSKSRRPDYAVAIGTSQIIFEVKELSKDKDLSRAEFSVSTRVVGDHIRSKISEAKKQIQFGSKQGLSSVLLIYNDIDLRFGTEDRDFISAMYGEHALKIGVESRRILDRYHGLNKSLTRDKNTSFSALGRLFKHPLTGEIAITLFENVSARKPLVYEDLPACIEVKRAEVER
jgi:hypothetical protein